MTTNRGNMPASPCKQTINRKTGDLKPYQFGNDDFVEAGMTIREKMAMAAMQGLWASNLTDMTPAKVATVAVKQADLLIAELEKSK